MEAGIILASKMLCIVLYATNVILRYSLVFLLKQRFHRESLVQPNVNFLATLSPGGCKIACGDHANSMADTAGRQDSSDR